MLGDLVEACRAQDFTDLILVHEHRGEPDGLVVSHMPYGPTAYFGIFNTVCVYDPTCRHPTVHTVSQVLRQ